MTTINKSKRSRGKHQALNNTCKFNVFRKFGTLLTSSGTQKHNNCIFEYVQNDCKYSYKLFDN